ncbi:MAG: 50S ribosomal protein L29 [Saprospiraceae bacterium]|nr:50S ribosomal protein L29 [Saprospiraceae bacterium]
MPSKKSLELKEFTLEDLRSELAETQAQYQKMKFDHATKGLENPLALREVRRDVARMKSEIRNREIVSMDESALAKRSKIRARRAKRK